MSPLVIRRIRTPLGADIWGWIVLGVGGSVEMIIKSFVGTRRDDPYKGIRRNAAPNAGGIPGG